MDTDNKTIDSQTLERVGAQIGSNPAGIYQDASGQRYYIKELESPAHARNEYLAAKLYQLAGAPTLTYVATTAQDQVATQWLPLDKKYIAHLSEAERKQAQHWLAVHAWTANWDAAGYDGDNQGVVAGKVITLDVGGALSFRAHGDPKGKAFGNAVGELESLRHDPNNPHAMKLFADMSPTEIGRAIQVVTQIPDRSITETVLENGGKQSLADKMIARKADLRRQLDTVTELRNGTS